MIPVIQLLGGKGTRLEKITKGLIPKPLVKLNDISLVEQQIIHLLRFGCKDFIWVCHYMHQLFEEEKERLLVKYGLLIDSIEIYKEYMPLGTFGSLYSVIENNAEEDFLVLYGDIIVNFDLYRFYKNFKIFKNSDTHIYTRFSTHPDDSDKIFIDENNYISKFISKKDLASPEHPSTTTSGIYIAKKSFFYKLRNWSGQNCDLYSEVLPQDSHLIKASAYQASEFILDIGTEERYKEAINVLQSEDFIQKSYLFSKPALLLDRDGVIIKKKGYITDKNDVEFNNELIKIISTLRKKGILIGIITNQPHVSQGRLNDFKHNLIKNFIIKKLAEKEAIDFYYECKHYPEKNFKDEVKYYKKSCYCRKPRTGLIQKAIHEHNLDISRSLFIGDSYTDILAGENCFIKSLFYEFSEEKRNSQQKNAIKNLSELLDFYLIND